MKQCLFVFGFLFFMGAFSGPMDAKLPNKIFKSEEKVTAGQLFLNQVDTVCLYLGTERLVYVPNLTADRHLNVAMNFVDFSSKSNLEPLQGLTLRHIETFNKTLKERLDFYTPRLAEEFNPNEDVTFVVNIGVDRKKVAEWKQGTFQWIGGAETEAPVVSPTPTPETKATPVKEEDSSCATCPALVGEKKETEVTPTPPAEEAKPKEETTETPQSN